MQIGELDIADFDRAVLNALCADFLPFNPVGGTTGPNYSPTDGLGFGIDGRDAGDDPSCVASKPQRQVAIPGVTGTGTDGRVLVVWDFPEDEFNRYIVPGIRVKRLDIQYDDMRRMGQFGGMKYRVPSDKGTPVTIETPAGPVTGHSAYVEREHAEPYMFSYEIEARARFQLEAQKMRRFICRALKDRSFLGVRDSLDTLSHFTVFRDDITDASDYVDSLDRFHSYIVSYRVQAQTDDYEETEKRAVTGSPDVRYRGEP